MEYFATTGVFWLPERTDRRVTGTLTFDPDRLALQVHDSLHPFEVGEGGVVTSFGEWQTVPVVHGRLHDGRDVTLLNASGISMASPVGEVTEDWRVDFVLSGGHVTGDLFDQALFDFDALMPWARPPGIATAGDTLGTVQADAREVGVFETETVAGTTVRLLSGASGRWNRGRVHLDQWCQFETTGHPRPIRDVLHEWVRPLQDLLIVCLGRSVRITSLLVRPPGAGPQSERLTVTFEAVQPAPRRPPTQSEIENYNAPTLITRSNSPIPIEEVVATWYETCERFSDVVMLLCVPFHAPFIFSEQRYASTFQAAEALARELFTSAERAPTDHAQRVGAVTAALEHADVDEDIVDWATRVLQNSNYKSLRTLIEELTRGTGGIGARILDTLPNFARDVARARAGVSHGGAAGTDALRRHWLGEVLAWIVRVQLLVEAGLPLDDLVARVVGKQRFGHATNELADPS